MYIFLALLLLLLSFPSRIFAIYDPLSVPNNKYGIHSVEALDTPDIPALINSTGGDWGYMTIVIGDNDRNPDKWQKVFDQMRVRHIIPIIRISTHVERNSWIKPKPDSFHEWVDFLSKLIWVTKNRYVILWNEPNHANEWGGEVNPEEYARRFVDLAKELKQASDNFFILPAGLDASAGSDNESMDEAVFLKRMLTEKPEIPTVIDGWTSHSYPNPGFSGSPFAFGRGTLRTFDWELSYLSNLGITKTLPVFITETGWIHSEGQYANYTMLSSDRVGENLRIAASTVWTDPRIVAITPFVFNYQGLPFDHFSWRKLGSREYYPQYTAYQQIPKVKGKPVKTERFDLLARLLPPTMITGSEYSFTTQIRNTGESILDQADGYSLLVSDPSRTFAISTEPLPYLEPLQTGSITIHIKTPLPPGNYTIELAVVHDNDRFPLIKQEVSLMPPPSLAISAQLGWRRTSNANNVMVLIYQKDNTLIQKFTGRNIVNGKLTIDRLIGVIPNDTYRIVMTVPRYLPRQVIIPINPRETRVIIPRFLPFDINGDGALTIADIFAFLTMPPKEILPLFFGP